MTGPSCCLLYRRVAPLICAACVVVIDLGELGRNLGLGARVGPCSTVMALARLETFHVGAWCGHDCYSLRRAVAPLGDRQAGRLPEPARAIHYRSVAHLLAVTLSEHLSVTVTQQPPGTPSLPPLCGR